MTRKPYNFRMSGRRMVRRGFTLTELLVVVGLFIVLMVAVSSIFSSTSKAVGTGQAISEGLRDLQASQRVFENDTSRLLTSNTPFLIITNRRESAFANANDARIDQDYDPSLGTTTAANRIIQERTIRTFVDPNSPVGAEMQYSPVLLNVRSHRVDQIQFFAAGRFPHQTSSSAGAYVSPMTSDEAFITYGHVLQPDSGGIARGLGPDFFDAQLNSTSMLTYGGTGGSPTNPNNFYASQWILGRRVILLRQPTAGVINDDNSLAQQFYGGLAAGSTSGDGNRIDQQLNVAAVTAQYDLAGITSHDMRLAVNTTPLWWTLMDYRFLADMYPVRPVTSAALGKTVPAFVPHCTQFAVEYAGDFVTQDVLGNVTAGVPDGRIDFYVVNLATNPTYLTRWYGFPRNIHGTNSVLSYAAGRGNNDLVDVVPLRDVLQTCTAGPLPPLAFERNVNTTIPVPASGDYAGITGGVPDTAPNAQYMCAWGPDEQMNNLMPKMIRFIVTVEDPSGKVPDGQTVEDVFNLH